jgi:hypothetical protein|tara:strand:- start:825 stop:1388 length:564 start_codon:yes stop_codon:yes gene_type:complete
MQSPYSFIVTPLNNKRYDNTTNIGGIEFITSTSEENHKASNRFAEVVALPINYKGEVQVGDTLVVHHNVFKFYNDMYGRRKSGKSFLKENLFLIDPDQFYLYKNNGVWKGYDKYCFIKPITKKDSFISKGGSVEPLMGKIKYINSELEDLGLNIDDVVSFQPESEYEFVIEGEVLYRMYTNNITMVL